MEFQKLLYDETNLLPDIFKPEEIQRMLGALQNSNGYLKNIWGDFMRTRDVTILMTIYLMGLRPNEACSLRFDDFDIKNRTVKIRGENNKVKKDRVVPVPDELIKYYSDYLKFRREHFWKGSKYLFPSFENEHISAGHWKYIMREKVLKPAGLWIAPIDNGTGNKTPKYRSYTLRHTRATEILNHTNDIWLVANFLGHAKLNSTKVYLHKSEKYMDYMKSKINSMAAIQRLAVQN
jgi:integrase/recombinase XerC